MLVLINVTETWFLYIGIVLATILIIGAILYFTCGLRSKRDNKKVSEHVNVDEAFMSVLLEGLGSLTNIESVSIDNGRIKFIIKDLDNINAEQLKEISTSGVFITGSNVKLLFKYDSNTILEELIKRGVSKC